MTGFRSAVSFLTRIPVGVGRVSVEKMGAAAAWFPLVGSLVGLVVAGAYGLAYQVVSPLLAATFAVAVSLVTTGAFHEDGLADTADAIGSGARGERALKIMRDPRLGTFGTVALVVSLIWRVGAISALDPVVAWPALVLAYTLARAGAVVLIAIASPAAPKGLGLAMAGGGSSRATVPAVVSALVISAFAAGPWVVPGVLVVAGTIAGFHAFSVRRLGGVTGDVLGACEQVGEILVLGMAVAAVSLGYEPWWLGTGL